MFLDIDTLFDTPELADKPISTMTDGIAGTTITAPTNIHRHHTGEPSHPPHIYHPTERFFTNQDRTLISRGIQGVPSVTDRRCTLHPLAVKEEEDVNYESLPHVGRKILEELSPNSFSPTSLAASNVEDPNPNLQTIRQPELVMEGNQHVVSVVVDVQQGEDSQSWTQSQPDLPRIDLNHAHCENSQGLEQPETTVRGGQQLEAMPTGLTTEERATEADPNLLVVAHQLSACFSANHRWRTSLLAIQNNHKKSTKLLRRKTKEHIEELTAHSRPANYMTEFPIKDQRAGYPLNWLASKGQTKASGLKQNLERLQMAYNLGVGSAICDER